MAFLLFYEHLLFLLLINENIGMFLLFYAAGIFCLLLFFGEFNCNIIA